MLLRVIGATRKFIAEHTGRPQTPLTIKTYTPRTLESDKFRLWRLTALWGYNFDAASIEKDYNVTFIDSSCGIGFRFQPGYGQHREGVKPVCIARLLQEAGFTDRSLEALQEEVILHNGSSHILKYPRST